MEWINAQTKKPNHLEDVKIKHWIPFRVVEEDAIYLSNINAYMLRSGGYAKQVEWWKPLYPNLERENDENKPKYFWE